MALVVIPVEFSWRDAKGWVGGTRYHITADGADSGFFADVSTTVNALQAAIGGLTNAAYAGSSKNEFIGSNPALTYGDNAEYPASWMHAWMTFSTDLGQISRFRIPAPEIDLFELDGITIKNDGTQAQVVAYVNAVKALNGTAYVSTSGGLAYTHFEGGQLKLGKQPRRFNGRIKSATLVAGEGE